MLKLGDTEWGDDSDVIQVAIYFIVVKAVADDELVRDWKPYIISFESTASGSAFLQQGRHSSEGDDSSETNDSRYSVSKIGLVKQSDREAKQK